MVIVLHFHLGLFSVQIAGLVEVTTIELRSHHISVKVLADSEGVAGEVTGAVASLDGAGAVIIVNFCNQEVVDKVTCFVYRDIESSFLR